MLCAYCLPFYGVQIAIFQKWAKNYLTSPDYDALIKELRLIPKSTLLMLLKDAPWKHTYYVDHRVVFVPVDSDEKGSEEKIKEFFSIYPLPQADLDRYVEDLRSKFSCCR